MKPTVRALQRLFLGLGHIAMMLIAGAAGAETADLTLLERHRISSPSLDFLEPSGLALVPDGQSLLSISDGSKHVYRLSLRGDVSLAWPSQTPIDDPEGITFATDGSVIVVSEDTRTLTVLDPNTGATLSNHPLAKMKGFGNLESILANNPLNRGTEGVAIDPDTGRVFVVIENTPRLLLTLSADLTEILDWAELTKDAGFVSPYAKDKKLDVSGLAFGTGQNQLWIVSDTGRSLFIYDLVQKTAQRVGLTYAGDDDGDDKIKTVKNAEGIVVDFDTKKLYVVTDFGQGDHKKARLFVFALPDIQAP